MIVLQVLIIVTIQANNLAPTSSAPSIPIMLPNFSQLNKYQKPGHQEPKPKLVHEKPKHEEQETTLHTCLTKKFEHCEKLVGKSRYKHNTCLYLGISFYLKTYKVEAMGSDIERCIRDCKREHKKRSVLLLGACAKICYETYVKNHPHIP